MSKIQSEDLLLINRDGVDYQAKVDDLPGGGGGGGGGIEEAPNDGQQYVRQSKQWEPVESSNVDLSGCMPYDLTTLPKY